MIYYYNYQIAPQAVLLCPWDHHGWNDIHVCAISCHTEFSGWSSLEYFASPTHLLTIFYWVCLSFLHCGWCLRVLVSVNVSINHSVMDIFVLILSHPKANIFLWKATALATVSWLCIYIGLAGFCTRQHQIFCLICFITLFMYCLLQVFI